MFIYFQLCMNFSGILNFSGIHFISILIAISMNLFD